MGTKQAPYFKLKKIEIKKKSFYTCKDKHNRNCKRKSKRKRKEKKVIMNKDEFYCLECHKLYKEKDTDMRSKWIDEYVRYMGYCNLKCFDKLDETEKKFRLDTTYRYLDVAKRKHKWYMKNIHIPLREKDRREGRKKIHLS